MHCFCAKAQNRLIKVKYYLLISSSILYSEFCVFKYTPHILYEVNNMLTLLIHSRPCLSHVAIYHIIGEKLQKKQWELSHVTIHKKIPTCDKHR